MTDILNTEVEIDCITCSTMACEACPLMTGYYENRVIKDNKNKNKRHEYTYSLHDAITSEGY